MVDARNHQVGMAFHQLLVAQFHAVDGGAVAAVFLEAVFLSHEVDVNPMEDGTGVALGRHHLIGGNHDHIAKRTHQRDEFVYASGGIAVVVSNQYQWALGVHRFIIICKGIKKRIMFITLNKILSFGEVCQALTGTKPHSLNITVAITGWLI